MDKQIVKWALMVLSQFDRESNASHRVKAINVAIEALEKQISKKPLKLADTALSEYLSICPNCKEDCILAGDHFCANCGQALDWSEE